jgi:3-phenylpropionate/cinnamic acid dioxygenase small subunit
MTELATDDKSAQRILARAEIEQFYAEHFTMLDEGDAASWVGTFTEDGIFVPPAGRAELRGRETLRASTEKTVARLADAGTVRRHVLANLNLIALTGGRAEVRAYVLVVDSTAGESRITTSVLMRDELTSDGTRWYVARRVLHRDIDGPAR